MKVTKVAAAVAAVAVTFGIGAVEVAPASATDNIKTFGEQERLNGPNGMPYIAYTVSNFGPSKDPVPHNGKLYSAKLKIDTFGVFAPPMIERFGARSESGILYPSIGGASNAGMLYFDVVGVVPNSVVWNDGTRDILAWIPGKLPLDGKKPSTAPAPPAAPAPPPPPPPPAAPAPPPPGGDPFAVNQGGAMPAESDPAIVATPNDLAQPPFELNEAIVSLPGFNR